MHTKQSLVVGMLFPSGIVPGWGGAALLGLRVFVGAAFLFHGSGKWADLPGFAEEFSIPLWVAGMAALSQIGAAVALLPGVASPVAALTIGSNMLVAVSKLIGRGETFVNPHGHSWESAGFYALAGLSLYLLGPGKYSVDAWVLERLAGVAARKPNLHAAASARF